MEPMFPQPNRAKAGTCSQCSVGSCADVFVADEAIGCDRDFQAIDFVGKPGELGLEHQRGVDNGRKGGFSERTSAGVIPGGRFA